MEKIGTSDINLIYIKRYILYEIILNLVQNCENEWAPKLNIIEPYYTITYQDILNKLYNIDLG